MVMQAISENGANRLPCVTTLGTLNNNNCSSYNIIMILIFKIHTFVATQSLTIRIQLGVLPVDYRGCSKGGQTLLGLPGCCHMNLPS